MAHRLQKIFVQGLKAEHGQQARYWPFRHQWVNWLQQLSLLIIWATLQSGMLQHTNTTLKNIIFFVYIYGIMKRAKLHLPAAAYHFEV